MAEPWNKKNPTPPPPPKSPNASTRGAMPPPPPPPPPPARGEVLDDLEVVPDSTPVAPSPLTPGAFGMGLETTPAQETPAAPGQAQPAYGTPVYPQAHPGAAPAQAYAPPQTYAPGYAAPAYPPQQPVYPQAPAYAPQYAQQAAYAPPAAAPAPVAPPPPVETPASNEEMTGDIPDRDRIVVLGRRQSGKTIFLSSIYAKLWRSVDGMTAKALTGDVHKQLMTVHQMLHDGQWPPSTLGTSQIDLEIDYHGKRRLLVALDFAGELFSKAFVDDQSDWPGVKELVNHIDRAAAVLLLVDPSVVAGMDKQAAMEDDFGLVQSAQRIRNWPGGDRVPIVLVLTKMDQHQQLLDQFGGPMGFVRKHFPALLRLLKNIPIVQVSAVQAEPGPDGRPRPKRDSAPINLDHPLRFCLREIERAERRREIERVDEQRRAAESRAIADVQRAKRQIQRRVTFGVSAIAAVGTILLVLILVLNI